MPAWWWREASRACWELEDPEEAEVRCLLHVFDTLGVPPAAEAFVLELRSQTPPPRTARARLALLQPPAWAVEWRSKAQQAMTAAVSGQLGQALIDEVTAAVAAEVADSVIAIHASQVAAEAAAAARAADVAAKLLAASKLNAELISAAVASEASTVAHEAAATHAQELAAAAALQRAARGERLGGYSEFRQLVQAQLAEISESESERESEIGSKGGETDEVLSDVDALDPDTPASMSPPSPRAASAHASPTATSRERRAASPPPQTPNVERPYSAETARGSTPTVALIGERRVRSRGAGERCAAAPTCRANAAFAAGGTSPNVLWQLGSDSCWGTELRASDVGIISAASGDDSPGSLPAAESRPPRGAWRSSAADKAVVAKAATAVQHGDRKR